MGICLLYSGTPLWASYTPLIDPRQLVVLMHSGQFLLFCITSMALVLHGGRSWMICLGHGSWEKPAGPVEPQEHGHTAAIGSEATRPPGHFPDEAPLAEKSA